MTLFFYETQWASKFCITNDMQTQWELEKLSVKINITSILRKSGEIIVFNGENTISL
jgi:hypothetical protein